MVAGKRFPKFENQSRGAEFRLNRHFLTKNTFIYMVQVHIKKVFFTVNAMILFERGASLLRGACSTAQFAHSSNHHCISSSHSHPLDLTLVISYKNHQKMLAYFNHLAPFVLFYEKAKSKGERPCYNAPPPPKYASGAMSLVNDQIKTGVVGVPRVCIPPA